MLARFAGMGIPVVHHGCSYHAETQGVTIPPFKRRQGYHYLSSPPLLSPSIPNFLPPLPLEVGLGHLNLASVWGSAVSSFSGAPTKVEFGAF